MTDYVYRIRDWQSHFETTRSRAIDHCRYINVPNKQHGMGFTRIMAQIDGAAIYGTWILILGACSQQRAPREGWLTDTGRPAGRAWTVTDLAERWRRTEDEMARALDVLCSPRIAWIETLALEDALGAVSNAGHNDDRPEDRSASSDRLVAEGSDDERSPNAVEPGMLGDGVDEGPQCNGEGAPEGRGEERREGRGETDRFTRSRMSDGKSENRELVRAHLCRLRLGYSDRALDEWRGWLEDAGCKTIDEAVECLTWLKRKGREDGRKVDYARLADGYERMWRQKQRMAREQAAAATEAQAS